ncbi:SPFH domain-containing protein [Salinisphaera sp. G21_0]|uniref:SPFH domain-containing protein n=1 Tax=Salinisphaera sp. G21_0 TaxID=2821094 RepID=UPI001ADD1FDF|nr:SPFH domain-containing protein [Salinisphaera sp. G21_0]MBO9483833.1 hypothetical protein [Salinisphaera sp. G21_0]
MEEKLMIMFFVFLLFLLFPGEKAEAYDFYSYIPFLYKVPEGSVGVFRNGNQFYDDVYPAGVYPIWPSDEGFVTSIVPEKAAVTDILCITADGIIITFPQITVHYQVHEQHILSLVKGYGLDFVNPVIKDPVKPGVAHLCRALNAEAVYFDEFAPFKAILGRYLAEGQRDKGTGISICHLDIEYPRVPDVIIENHAGHNPDHKPQPPITCEPPYEIFYTLENEQEAINRLCGSVRQPDDEPYPEPVSEEDSVISDGHSTIVLEPSVSVAEDEVTGVLSPAEEVNTDDNGRRDYEVPQEDLPISWAEEPFINGQDSDGEDARPSEHSRDSSSEPMAELSVNTVPVDSSDVVTELSRNLPSGLVDQVSDQERSKEKLYQQMQDSKHLWKNNNSRLYLGW